MQIIPAIDLAAGKCVRLRQGDMNQRTIYSDAPADMARYWQDQGAEILHLVDLDGAMGGHSANLPTIEAIARAIEIPIELGGGLRTLDDIRRAMGLGIHWAILGTAALHHPEVVEAGVEQFGDRIIVGIDARAGRVAVAGWQETSGTPAVELARRMEELGVGKLICTDIATDGMMTGPNLESLRTMAEAVQVPVIASGGVSKLEDVVALKTLEPLGISGVITGKALYEGTLDLKAAIAAAR